MDSLKNIAIALMAIGIVALAFLSEHRHSKAELYHAKLDTLEIRYQEEKFEYLFIILRQDSMLQVHQNKIAQLTKTVEDVEKRYKKLARISTLLPEPK